jgi:hypothetical protein
MPAMPKTAPSHWQIDKARPVGPRTGIKKPDTAGARQQLTVARNKGKGKNRNQPVVISHWQGRSSAVSSPDDVSVSYPAL